MVLGILSDTHGRVQRTAAALRVLEQCGATVFAHCGDIGGPDVLELLAGRRVWLVRGNTDFPTQRELEYARVLGLTLADAAPARFELLGRHFLLFHGHEPEFGCLERNLQQTGARPPGMAACHYILHGHTHTLRDERVCGVRLINPGALHRALVHTVATLSLEQDELHFWRVDENEPANNSPVEVSSLRR